MQRRRSPAPTIANRLPTDLLRMVLNKVPVRNTKTFAKAVRRPNVNAMVKNRAATEIQRIVRGHLARHRLALERNTVARSGGGHRPNWNSDVAESGRPALRKFYADITASLRRHKPNSTIQRLSLDIIDRFYTGDSFTVQGTVYATVRVTEARRVNTVVYQKPFFKITNLIRQEHVLTFDSPERPWASHQWKTLGPDKGELLFLPGGQLMQRVNR